MFFFSPNGEDSLLVVLFWLRLRGHVNLPSAAGAEKESLSSQGWGHYFGQRLIGVSRVALGCERNRQGMKFNECYCGLHIWAYFNLC